MQENHTKITGPSVKTKADPPLHYGVRALRLLTAIISTNKLNSRLLTPIAPHIIPSASREFLLSDKRRSIRSSGTSHTKLARIFQLVRTPVEQKTKTTTKQKCTGSVARLVKALAAILVQKVCVKLTAVNSYSAFPVQISRENLGHRIVRRICTKKP